MQHTHLTGDSSNDDVGSDGSHSKAGDEFLSDYDLQFAAGNPHLYARAHTHTLACTRTVTHTRSLVTPADTHPPTHPPTGRLNGMSHLFETYGTDEVLITNSFGSIVDVVVHSHSCKSFFTTAEGTIAVTDQGGINVTALY